MECLASTNPDCITFHLPTAKLAGVELISKLFNDTGRMRERDKRGHN